MNHSSPHFTDYLLWTIVAGLFGIASAMLVSRASDIANYWWQSDGQLALVYDQTRLKSKTTDKPRELKLGFVGDIMLGRAVASSVNKNGQGNYDWLFTNVTSQLNSYDWLFGNLEGPISNRGQQAGSKFSFRFDPTTATSLARAGFDVLSVANNHIGDWGEMAFIDTLRYLDQLNIETIGVTERGAVITEKNGQRIAWLAFSDVGPSWLKNYRNDSAILLTNRPDFEKLIASAAEKSNLTIVSFHFGEEYQTTPNPRQRDLVERAMTAGAQVVVGHHPHVRQPVEIYTTPANENNRVVAYSLGNFIFDQYFSAQTMSGSLLELTWDGEKISNVKERTIKLNSHYQPQIQ
ncbi:MAG: CapA family protein [Patescibacteria group bacterium]